LVQPSRRRDTVAKGQPARWLPSSPTGSAPGTFRPVDACRDPR
jgi:hypothetical protein